MTGQLALLCLRDVIRGAKVALNFRSLSLSLSLIAGHKLEDRARKASTNQRPANRPHLHCLELALGSYLIKAPISLPCDIWLWPTLVTFIDSYKRRQRAFRPSD